MCRPRPHPDSIFAQLLQDLPPQFQEMAREFKAFTRARKIKSPAQLLRAVLLFAGLDLTEREVAADLLLSDPTLARLSDQAVRERLQACQLWVQALLPQLMAAGPVPELPSGLRLLVIDASDLTAPGEQRASWRLHIVMNLVSLHLVSLKLTDHHTGETLSHYAFAPGDVVLTDRGYCKAPGVLHALRQGAEVVTRYSAHNFPLKDAGGRALRLAAELGAAPAASLSSFEVSLELGDGRQRRAWVHAYRLSAAAAAAARRRARRAGQKRGYQPRQETLWLAEFVLVLSTLPPTVLSAETVLELYRCRWQVELLIKRWKSLLHLDHLRARAGSVLGAVWITGKLLYALLLERRLRRRCGTEWGGLDEPRQATWWRLWKLMQQEMAPLISGAEQWSLSQWQAALCAVSERRRRRTLQKLPAQAVEWLQKRPEEDLALAV